MSGVNPNYENIYKRLYKIVLSYKNKIYFKIYWKINLAFFKVQLENMRKLCNILIGKILKFIIILFIFLKIYINY